jgi:Bacterial SH3 domain
MKTFSKLFFLWLILFSFSNVFSQEEKERFVRPVDEAGKNSSFKIFRDNLLKASKKHDVTYILRIVDANIKNSFGGDDGFKNFKSNWKIENPKSVFWDEFITVMSNGGAFYTEASSRGTFCAPYPFMKFPSDVDAFEYAVIFGNNVNLRAEPASDAAIIANLSYNIVKPEFANEAHPNWVKVETLGGKKGYVSAKFVRSSIAYRACFEKLKGKWKMTAFIAGD